MAGRKPVETTEQGDPRDTGVLNHAPNLCLLCDGLRRKRMNLPQTGGRYAVPLPEEN